MSSSGRPQARVTYQFDASAERVFDAWLDPDRVAKWMFTTTPGEMVRVEIDPQVGGSFRFVHRRGGEDVDHFGRYLEIVRPSRLVFTWAVADEEGDDRVTVEITPSASGCELSLTHELHPDWADFADRTEAAWKGMFESLATVA